MKAKTNIINTLLALINTVLKYFKQNNTVNENQNQY